MIRQKNAWTCIPASGYDFPTATTTTTTASSTTAKQKINNGTVRHGQDGGTDDIDKDLKNLLLLRTADPDQDEEAKDEGETKEADIIDANTTNTSITIQYRHYEARLPIKVHSVSQSSTLTAAATTAGGGGGGIGRLARLSAVMAESEWKASQDDWASMIVVPEPIDGPNAGISTEVSTAEEPAGPATQKRLEVRNQKQIQKMQRRGSMTMKLVHKGKKAISKQAKKVKIQGECRVSIFVCYFHANVFVF